MKYSNKFIETYMFYLRNIEHFNFCGTQIPKFKAVSLDCGESAKYCFYKIDSQGINIPCKEPELLDKLLLCKASVNFHIKQWAESLAEGTLTLAEIGINRRSNIDDSTNYFYVWETVNDELKSVGYKSMAQYYNFPDWVLDAILNQCNKIKKIKSI